MKEFGVLMPVFSLPPDGTMDGADDFVEFLAASGARVWQVLPIGPPDCEMSPYLSLSAFAGNHRLIGLGKMATYVGQPVESVRAAFELVGGKDLASKKFAEFEATVRNWLPDYALFRALRRQFEERPWFEWPAALRSREPEALAEARMRLADEIDYVRWEQFIFFHQWREVRSNCRERGIRLFGDVPIYVSHDSADVWQRQSLFLLGSDGSATAVAGVPPDYFSPTGQLWGNPIYHWENMHAGGYRWWIARMQAQASLYDILRIDHFRAIDAYWEIPADADTAEHGIWRNGPGYDFLKTVVHALGDTQLVAEDLGIITAGVDRLRRAFDIPGIRVLQFGFDGVVDNPHGVDNIEENSVLATGTHDNDTSVGWYRDLDDQTRCRVNEALAAYEEPFPASLIACAFDLPARLVVVPMADLLGLDKEGRINTPGTRGNNWLWRISADWPVDEVRQMLLRLKAQYQR